MKNIRSIEAFQIKTYKSGQSFYMSIEDNDITALSTYYKVKIKTERLVCLDCKSMSVLTRLIKVTIC